MVNHRRDDWMDNMKFKEKEYTFKTNSKKVIKVPLECAVAGEELVWKVMKAKSPLELAQVFSNPKYSFLNSEVGDKIFNYALDLTQKTAGMPQSFEVADNLYFLNFIDYAKNEKVISLKQADKATEEILYSMGLIKDSGDYWGEKK